MYLYFTCILTWDFVRILVVAFYIPPVIWYSVISVPIHVCIYQKIQQFLWCTSIFYIFHRWIRTVIKLWFDNVSYFIFNFSTDFLSRYNGQLPQRSIVSYLVTLSLADTQELGKVPIFLLLLFHKLVIKWAIKLTFSLF